MWRLISKRLPLAAIGVLCGVHLAVAASAQSLPIEPENRAKLSRLKAKLAEREPCDPALLPQSLRA